MNVLLRSFLRALTSRIIVVASSATSVSTGGRFDIPRAKSVRKQKGLSCRIERAEGVKVK